MSTKQDNTNYEAKVQEQLSDIIKLIQDINNTMKGQQ